MITLHLEAESLAELIAKAVDVLGIVNYVETEAKAASMAPNEYPYEDLDDAAAWKTQTEETARARKAQQEGSAPVPPAPVKAPVPDKPKRGRPRAAKPPVAAPDPVKEEVMADVDLMSFEEDVVYVSPEEALQDLTPVSTPLVDTLANEKLKAEVIDRLADLFTAGKVKLLRSLLDTYGSGAKTFAEIDPGVFPKIRDAMQKGIDS